METNVVKKPFLLELANKLVLAQREVDELTLQLALGKAEATDKFEELKREFRNKISQFRQALNTEKLSALTNEIVSRLDLIEQRLNAEKIETREMLLVQKKQIEAALEQFEKVVKNRKPVSENFKSFMADIQSFKLKLEIIRLKMILKGFILKNDLQSNADEAQKKLSRIINKAKENIKEGRKRIKILRTN